MAGKKRVYEDDDGHTIANMNVEGMPWYDRAHRHPAKRDDPRPPMEPAQKRATIFAVVTAGLAVAAVFGIGYFLVILLIDTLFR